MTFFGNSPLFVPTLIVLSGVVIALVYLLYRIRQRQAAAHRNPESTQNDADRAFNQIQFVRVGCDVVEGQGFDVGPIRGELDRAEAAERRGDHAGALRHTEAARHGLHAIRGSRERPPDPRPEPEAKGTALPLEPAPIPTDPTGPEGTEPDPSPPRPKFPPFQIETRFAMNLLAEELAGPAGDASEEPRRSTARAQLEEARAAYAREEYATAWKLVLRGRRSLGGRMEAISPEGPSTPGTSAPAGLAPTASGGVPAAPSVMPDRACSRCGRSVAVSDAFCRSCGAPSAALRCPRCQAPLDASDQFCGVCGTPRGG
ncbi:MAG: zinc ribbon domain-containing protein [Thermoplasmata archaeon]